MILKTEIVYKVIELLSLESTSVEETITKKKKAIIPRGSRN